MVFKGKKISKVLNGTRKFSSRVLIFVLIVNYILKESLSQISTSTQFFPLFLNVVHLTPELASHTHISMM